MVIKIFQHKKKRQNESVWKTSSLFYYGAIAEYTDGTAHAKMVKFSIVFPLHSFTMSMDVSLL